MTIAVGLALLVALLVVALWPRRAPLTLREQIERENLARLRRHALFAPPPHAHDGRLEETWVR